MLRRLMAMGQSPRSLQSSSSRWGVRADACRYRVGTVSFEGTKARSRRALLGSWRRVSGRDRYQDRCTGGHGSRVSGVPAIVLL